MIPTIATSKLPRELLYIIAIVVLSVLLIRIGCSDTSKDYQGKIDSLTQQKQALQATADSLELLIITQDTIVEREIASIPVQQKKIHENINRIRLLPPDSSFRHLSEWVSQADTSGD